MKPGAMADAFGRERHTEPCEFQASQGYRVKLCLKQQQKWTEGSGKRLGTQLSWKSACLAFMRPQGSIPSSTNTRYCSRSEIQGHSWLYTEFRLAWARDSATTKINQPTSHLPINNKRRELALSLPSGPPSGHSHRALAHSSFQ